MPPDEQPLRPKRFSQEQFEELVAEALDQLPSDIRSWLDNVALIVAEAPTPDQLRRAGVRPGGSLFGLYQGVPKTRRGVTYGESFPDKIVIFQRPIERFCRTRREVRDQVRRTVLHEVGHHFGLGEADLEDAGL
ncbi:MAG TPA: metallopeptidase family protein [Anaerolineae bacterium]|nr:metallopeptidase family protein [Anaerolineae bacterium]